MENKNDLPQTLEELTARIESMFELGEPGTSAFAVTGEPFIKLAIGGRLYEGEEPSVIATFEKKAIEVFWLNFLKFAEEKTKQSFKRHKLYWRTKPQLAQNPYIQENYQCIDMGYCKEDIHDESCKAHNRSVHYHLRARLLISDKEPKQ